MAFHETKSTLSKLIEEITEFMNDLRRTGPLLSSMGDQFFVLKENLLWCYYFNQCVLNHLYRVKQKILAGELNNQNNYLESDLQLTSSIIDCIIQYQKAEKIGPYFSMKKIHEIIKTQLTCFNELMHYFPEDMAINYKIAPKEFTSIRLDFYQLIHLALLHSKCQLRTVELFTKISRIGSTEVSSKFNYNAIT